MTKTIKTIVMGAALLVSNLLMADEGVAGKWQGSVDTPQGPMALMFTFEVDGTSLSGNVASDMGVQNISDGSVNSNEIAFKQTMEGGPNGPMIINFKGKLEDEKLVINLAMDGMPEGMMPPITATRAE